DHADCILRHLIDAGTIDEDGHRHTAKVAWRALALLQEELEREEGAPLPRNCRSPATDNNKETNGLKQNQDTVEHSRVSDLQAHVFSPVTTVPWTNGRVAGHRTTGP